MTAKKALKVWILIVFAFLSMLGALHAWILWRLEGVSIVTIFYFTMEITTYFLTTLLITFLFIGAICFAVFHSDSLELPLYQLGRDLEFKLDAKSEDIKSSTDEALTKLGLREFRLKESMKDLQKQLGELDAKLKESADSQGKALETAQKKLTEMERKIDRMDVAQKELPKLDKRLEAMETLESNLKDIKETVEKLNSLPQPYLTSTNEIDVLEGRVLKPSTVRQLKQSGIEKVEDLLLKSPVEIAMTKTMSDGEAKSLQSVIQLMMIPGIQHQDAMLLLKSGVNSTQELALQDTLSLGARMAKTAGLYVQEGKIRENDKPTLEEIASWIKSAKTQ